MMEVQAAQVVQVAAADVRLRENLDHKSHPSGKKGF
jgi:hypothetical protein